MKVLENFLELILSSTLVAGNVLFIYIFFPEYINFSNFFSYLKFSGFIFTMIFVEVLTYGIWADFVLPKFKEKNFW